MLFFTEIKGLEVCVGLCKIMCYLRKLPLILALKKETSGARATLMKINSSGAGARAMFTKKELRSQSCVISMTAL